jgi:hypothetical protein
MLQFAISAMLSFVLGVGSSSNFVTSESYRRAEAVSPEIILVGSTPGDAMIKSMVGIDPLKNVDFIRWHLALNEKGKTFVLNATYGVGKPNTRDFEGGGEKLLLEGSYVISNEGKLPTYKLMSDKSPKPISVLKLNDDLFHILSPDDRLMVGSGGWSYSLSRKQMLTTRSKDLPSFSRADLGKSPTEVEFVGRTPCEEIAKEYEWSTSDECFKLKWKLVLFRDPKTGEPTTYNLQRTLHRAEPIKGKWTIVNGPKQMIYRLDPDRPDISISLLVGDENVLFFLDKENRLFGGNSEFSYTLNRRSN